MPAKRNIKSYNLPSKHNYVFVSFKTRYQHHKCSSIFNTSTHTTLSAYIKKNNSDCCNTSWSIRYKTLCNLPQKPETCTIFKLKRVVIAKFNKGKSLSLITEVAALWVYDNSNLDNSNSENSSSKKNLKDQNLTSSIYLKNKCMLVLLISTSYCFLFIKYKIFF